MRTVDDYAKYRTAHRDGMTIRQIVRFFHVWSLSSNGTGRDLGSIPIAESLLFCFFILAMKCFV
jgi:hypothetical protein